VKDIFILGGGGQAKETAFLLEDINRASSEPEWNILGYIDNDPEKQGKYNGKYAVIGNEDYLINYGKTIYAVIGIGWPGIISKIHDKLRRFEHIRFPNLIHPNVIMDAEGINIGNGNIICAGNVLTTDITIGSHNVLNRLGTYGHDVIIGSCCVFNPGINVSGNVIVKDGCLLGASATILQNLTIGEGATVGAAALVTKDVPAGITVTGVPAEPRSHA
jgi:sugar O-acyltransferase (sialic acid O-acetyltransferase NeuD family)